jgi:hypothetical protein
MPRYWRHRVEPCRVCGSMFARTAPSQRWCGDLCRFLDKLIVLDLESCWGWTATPDTNGYGILRYPNGEYDRAHRLSYMLFHGPIAEGMVICHRCDNPICANPAHLFIGTQADNLRDMRDKGRSNKGIKATPEALRNMSIAQKALAERRVNPFLGRKHTAETKAKIAEARRKCPRQRGPNGQFL